MLTAQEFSDFIFGDSGLITKYHNGRGLDEKLVDQFYVYLEEYRQAWRDKPDIPRDIVSHLVSVAVGLHDDLHLYQSDPDRDCGPTAVTLAGAIEIMLSPTDDFDRELREFDMGY